MLSGSRGHSQESVLTGCLLPQLCWGRRHGCLSLHRGFLRGSPCPPCCTLTLAVWTHLALRSLGGSGVGGGPVSWQGQGTERPGRAGIGRGVAGLWGGPEAATLSRPPPGHSRPRALRGAVCRRCDVWTVRLDRGRRPRTGAALGSPWQCRSGDHSLGGILKSELIQGPLSSQRVGDCATWRQGLPPPPEPSSSSVIAVLPFPSSCQPKPLESSCPGAAGSGSPAFPAVWSFCSPSA